MKRITLAELARRAGVAKSTASYALRNSPLASSETRERVQRIATEIGYTQSPLTSLLMAGVRQRTSRKMAATIGFINNFQTFTRMVELDHFRLRWEGALEHASKLGFNLEVFTPQQMNLSLDRLAGIFLSRGIRGVIIGPLGNDWEGQAIQFPWKDFACATMGSTVREPALHRAAAGRFRGTFQLYERLYRQGFRKIALSVNIATNRRVDYAFRAAFAEAQMVTEGHHDENSLFQFTDSSFGHQFTESARVQFMQWFESYRPEVILCHGQRETHELRAMGVKVPEEVSLVRLIRHMQEDRNMACLDYREGKIGAAAVDLVVEQLNQNLSGLPEAVKVVLIEPILIPGPTLRERW